jgi:hypothetical protein
MGARDLGALLQVSEFKQGKEGTRQGMVRA